MIKVKKSMVCLMASVLLLSSCIGSFGLFNKVLDWNKEATSSKFVNEVLFIVLHIIPVYEVCGVVDVLVLNTVEFWTGDNPIASHVGKTQKVMGSDGKMYAVTNLKDGYEIKNEAGEVVDFKFDKAEKVWSLQTQDGTTVKLLKVKDNNTAEVYLPNGKNMEVSMDNLGLYQVRMAAGNGMYFAAR